MRWKKGLFYDIVELLYLYFARQTMATKSGEDDGRRFLVKERL